ncbi:MULTISPECIES: tRNA dihydrouridine(20/20a) synthase DusA [unclassified Neisseria]|uniref:tRNA dihydrouridine(20/20a) synthase DusA n=1 Tax=unclassified Neisseria TaxID=2623750 RepID=UPI002666A202|nr:MULTISPECIES: tRNA dihydrouridine(20/20a) synthase DusA [unclassified Neisseria]MDO1510231.1 tRNA dihydrouridine(20/20a) synthase DusA [Neisseria sp. MVDL19-042950]MDO1516400.1 tRNA dihydrouridine(20/20a) synthase DusA [Neisseria sp. MVDL18-041461]MDO1563548.1 tRNA dihydrouridine(20/20a) synthase DusA [Neisseria sp. MVDL20-010259]
MNNKILPPRRLSTAPMLDWSDRHYRYMARQISRYTWLYSEMINAGAIIYGDKDRFLMCNECENPVALQLGGSEPSDLARAAKAAEEYGYDEVNLNCGCPSPRVQKGAFGACLMNEVGLVADCLKAMQDAVQIDVTVKHRIGVDRQTEYGVVQDFVGTLAAKTSCKTFIVHARNAWLDGLSPKENREVPPLKYDYVYRLKQDFPELEIIINGGITRNDEIAVHLEYVDGVMVGREAYHNPMVMREWDRLFYGGMENPIEYADLVERLFHYSKQQIQAGRGTILRHMVRHYLGLMHGLKGARTWRRMLSDAVLLKDNNGELILDAWDKVKKANDWV